MMEDRLSLLFPGFRVRSQTAGWLVEGGLLGFPVAYLFLKLDDEEKLDADCICRLAEQMRKMDVARAYLLHTHQFKKKTADLAAIHGITLLEWSAFLAEDCRIQPGMPIAYFDPALKTAEVKLDVYLNNQMSLHPPDKLVTRQEDEGMVSLDGGATVIRLSDHLVARYLEKKPNIAAYEKLDLREERIWIRMNGAWLLTNVLVDFKWSKPAYLVYLTLDELEQFRPHWRGKKINKDIPLTPAQLPLMDHGVKVGSPYGWPVKTIFQAVGPFILPRDMTAWIPEHISYHRE